MYKIIILAGESSGDILAAELIQELRKTNIAIDFIGIVGPCMQQLGVKPLGNIKDLSVMGLTEIIKFLPKLFAFRNKVIKAIINLQPDLVIAIDYPEFNLSVEKKIKKHGIRTIHYVSPSIWAWRANRLKTIKKSVDLMLCLFHFEVKLYRQYNITAKYVGHPLLKNAGIICHNADNHRKSNNKKAIILLPGSRTHEVQKLLPIFLTAVTKYRANVENIAIYLSCANKNLFVLIKKYSKNYDNIILINSEQTKQVIKTVDLAICASGTITLELAMNEIPAIVCYVCNKITWIIARYLGYIKHISLPNILARREIYPELLQDDCTEIKLYENLFLLLSNQDKIKVALQKLKADLTKSKPDGLKEIILQELDYVNSRG